MHKLDITKWLVGFSIVVIVVTIIIIKSSLQNMGWHIGC
jgi:hypothetical protein